VKILKQHGEAHFQDFRIGQARIGHVGVDRVGAVKARQRSRVFYRKLMALDDRMLNDIGIARADILAVAKGIER